MLRRHRRPRRPADARQARSWSATTPRRSTPACRARSRPAATTRWRRSQVPADLEVTATTPDGEVMGVRHRDAADARRAVPPGVGADAARPRADRELPGHERSDAVITDAIKKLVEGQDLPAEETHAAMMQVMGGDASPAQIAAFSVALRMKGETPDEIAGCARAMRAHVTPSRPAAGGPGRHLRHGRRRPRTPSTSRPPRRWSRRRPARRSPSTATGRCPRAAGSADVLEALGVRIDLAPQDIADCIDEVGFGFLFAQAHHPAMRHVGPGPPRAGRPHRLQPARAADQPGRRPPPGAGRVRREPGRADRAGAGRRSAPSARWSCTAPAGSTS